MCVSPTVAKWSPVGVHRSLQASVPCGHCYECVRKRKLDWEIRLTVESTAWPNKFFGMLTYSDDFYHDHVDSKEISYFIKRLRYNLDKFYPGATLKYFLVSEYGELRDRLHYHVLYFVSKEFDDTFREFQVLVEMSWVKKVPLSQDDIDYRRDIYKRNKKRLTDKKRLELLRWSRKKYDDLPLGFATAQNLRHGSAVGSISYACKYIQKQYNKMYFSRMGYDVWREFMIKEGVLVPTWNRSFDDIEDGFACNKLFEFNGDSYPTFPVRGTRYPVPVRWMLNTVGKFRTTNLRSRLAKEMFAKNGPKIVDFNRQAYFEFKEPERMDRVTRLYDESLSFRAHNIACRTDFENDELEWLTSTTQKHLSHCPVEVDSICPTETLLPLKWPS